MDRAKQVAPRLATHNPAKPPSPPPPLVLLLQSQNANAPPHHARHTSHKHGAHAAGHWTHTQHHAGRPPPTPAGHGAPGPTSTAPASAANPSEGPGERLAATSASAAWHLSLRRRQAWALPGRLLRGPSRQDAIHSATQGRNTPPPLLGQATLRTVQPFSSSLRAPFTPRCAVHSTLERRRHCPFPRPVCLCAVDSRQHLSRATRPLAVARPDLAAHDVRRRSPLERKRAACSQPCAPPRMRSPHEEPTLGKQVCAFSESISGESRPRGKCGHAPSGQPPQRQPRRAGAPSTAQLCNARAPSPVHRPAMHGAE